MPFTAEYDSEADALYLRVDAAGDRARTIEIDDVTYVDVDEQGRAAGIELLYPSMGINLAGVARTFGLLAEIPAMARAIAESGAPVSVPTVTGGGTLLMNTTIVSTAVEGTIATSGRDVHAVGVAHADRVIYAC